MILDLIKYYRSNVHTPLMYEYLLSESLESIHDDLTISTNKRASVWTF